MSAVTAPGGRALDDCWNRIGIQGDRSCLKLERHTHCRNCEVYAAAARALLDIALPPDHLAHWTSHVAKPREQRTERTESVLILRSGAEWLGLATAICGEVVCDRPIRSLPHRRHAAVLGLANVAGELVVCFSLAALLGIRPSEDEGVARLIIVNGADAPTALKVDEVHGTHRFDPRDLARAATIVPGTASSATSAGTHLAGTLRWRERTVGILDERALLARAGRCLA
jgi:chemotaxis signal transduction protein